MDIDKQNDKEVEKLEKKLRKVYLQAQADTQAKMEDYLQRFATKDAIKLEQVKQGKITQAQYLEWRKGQIAVGKQWQDKVDALAADYTNANKIAMGMVRNDMAGTFATNHNYAAYQLEHDTSLDLSFTLYDQYTLKNLVARDPNLLPLPSVDIPKDLRWNKQKINSVITQAVLQGDSIPKIAQSLRRVTDMNHSAAVRNARTSMTAAQNAGRVESYKHAQDMGIDMQQEWLATLDGRTRHSHRQMDGERIAVAKDKWHPAKFSNGCRYPGDPQGPAWEIYNCRCTLVAAVEGIDQSDAPRNSKLGGMSYDEWKNAHKAAPPQTVTQPTPPVQTPKIKTVEKYVINTQDLSREEVEETWFDYDSANVIKEYIETGAFPDTTLSGEKLSASQKDALASTAEYIKTEANKNSGYNTLYRGMVLDPDQARVMFNPGSDYTFDNLTSTSKDKGIASIYSSGDYLENAENGVPVMITIQKPDGIRGMNVMDDAETILPIGSTFKVAKNFMDKDGVIHVEMYLSSKKKQVP